MAGLEKILDEIKKQSHDNIIKIENEARQEADEIINAQKQKLEKEKQAFEKELEKEEKLELEKGISSAMSIKKKMILEKKQSAINDIIEKSKQYIQNLEREDYINFLEKIAITYAHKKDGIIRLTKKDKQEFGDEFVSRLNTKLLQNSKGTLKLDDVVFEEMTGFVMIYDDIEENCSLEAIFSEKKEMLEDKINSFLFL